MQGLCVWDKEDTIPELYSPSKVGKERPKQVSPRQKEIPKCEMCELLMHDAKAC